MNNLYDSSFSNTIKKKINNGEFKTKEDLINYLKNLNNLFFIDIELSKQLESQGFNLNSDSLNELTVRLLDYYDKTKTNISSLNLDGVSQIKIDNKEYIKIRNDDGSYKVFDDSMSNDSFVKQFQDRQNNSFNYQTNDGVKNRNEIIKDMEKDKEGANLDSSVDINTRRLTQEEQKEFSAIMKMSNMDKMNFVVDPVRNIYINKDTGEVYYAYKNKEGKIEVRKTDEQTVVTEKKNVSYIDESNIENNIDVENPIEDNFDKLDDFELQYIVNNRLSSLTLEQQEKLNRIIEQRKQEKNQEVKEEQIDKPKIMRFGVLQKPNNGFIDVLILCLITALYGLGIILYIIIKI